MSRNPSNNEVADTVVRLLQENRLRPFFLFEALSTRVVEASELADVDLAIRDFLNPQLPSWLSAQPSITEGMRKQS